MTHTNDTDTDIFTDKEWSILQTQIGITKETFDLKSKKYAQILQLYLIRAKDDLREALAEKQNREQFLLNRKYFLQETLQPTTNDEIAFTTAELVKVQTEIQNKQRLLEHFETNQAIIDGIVQKLKDTMTELKS